MDPSHHMGDTPFHISSQGGLVLGKRGRASNLLTEMSNTNHQFDRI